MIKIIYMTLSTLYCFVLNTFSYVWNEKTNVLFPLSIPFMWCDIISIHWLISDFSHVWNEKANVLFPILNPFIWCGIILTHWLISDWTLHSAYLAVVGCFFIPTFPLAFGSSHIQQSLVHWPRGVAFQSGELISSTASNFVILESSYLVTLCRWLSSIVPTCFIGRAALVLLWKLIRPKTRFTGSSKVVCMLHFGWNTSLK